MPTQHPALNTLGRAVRARRLARDLTLAALSKRAHVSERFLIQLESGRGNISVARLCDVAEALGTTPSVLLEGVHSDSPEFVALVGMRGAGKSTIGPQVARTLELPFVELDEEIESAAGMSLGEVFELHGETFYRRLERDTLRRLFREGKPAVFATGGSIVTDPETYDLLRRNAVTVWLKARPEEHLERVRAQGDERPMRNSANALVELRGLLRARTPLYSQADHVVDTTILGVDGAVGALVETLTVTKPAEAPN